MAFCAEDSAPRRCLSLQTANELETNRTISGFVRDESRAASAAAGLKIQRLQIPRRMLGVSASLFMHLIISSSRQGEVNRFSLSAISRFVGAFYSPGCELSILPLN